MSSVYEGNTRPRAKKAPPADGVSHASKGRSRRFSREYRIPHVYEWLGAIYNSGGKGQGYVDRMRFIARGHAEFVEYARKPRGGPTQAYIEDETACVKKAVEQAYKSLIRSKSKGKPWFPPISKYVTSQLGSTYNQFCKWLGEAILAGDPAGMPPILLEDPVSNSDAPLASERSKPNIVKRLEFMLGAASTYLIKHVANLRMPASVMDGSSVPITNSSTARPKLGQPRQRPRPNPSLYGHGSSSSSSTSAAGGHGTDPQDVSAATALLAGLGHRGGGLQPSSMDLGEDEDEGEAGGGRYGATSGSAGSQRRGVSSSMRPAAAGHGQGGRQTARRMAMLASSRGSASSGPSSGAQPQLQQQGGGPWGGWIGGGRGLSDGSATAPSSQPTFSSAASSGSSRASAGASNGSGTGTAPASLGMYSGGHALSAFGSEPSTSSVVALAAAAAAGAGLGAGGHSSSDAWRAGSIGGNVPPQHLQRYHSGQDSALRFLSEVTSQQTASSISSRGTPDSLPDAFQSMGRGSDFGSASVSGAASLDGSTSLVREESSGPPVPLAGSRTDSAGSSASRSQQLAPAMPGTESSGHAQVNATPGHQNQKQGKPGGSQSNAAESMPQLNEDEESAEAGAGVKHAESLARRRSSDSQEDAPEVAQASKATASSNAPAQAPLNRAASSTAVVAASSSPTSGVPADSLAKIGLPSGSTSGLEDSQASGLTTPGSASGVGPTSSGDSGTPDAGQETVSSATTGYSTSTTQQGTMSSHIGQAEVVESTLISSPARPGSATAGGIESSAGSIAVTSSQLPLSAGPGTFPGASAMLYQGGVNGSAPIDASTGDEEQTYTEMVLVPVPVQRKGRPPPGRPGAVFPHGPSMPYGVPLPYGPPGMMGLSAPMGFQGGASGPFHGGSVQAGQAYGQAMQTLPYSPSVYQYYNHFQYAYQGQMPPGQAYPHPWGQSAAWAQAGASSAFAAHTAASLPVPTSGADQQSESEAAAALSSLAFVPQEQRSSATGLQSASSHGGAGNSAGATGSQGLGATVGGKRGRDGAAAPMQPAEKRPRLQ